VHKGPHWWFSKREEHGPEARIFQERRHGRWGVCFWSMNTAMFEKEAALKVVNLYAVQDQRSLAHARTSLAFFGRAENTLCTGWWF